MTQPTCTLSIMAARTDLPFMMHTIPHLVRMCNFPFVERMLVVDTAPLSGDKVSRPGIGTMEQLRECCDRLLAEEVVDRVVDINYEPDYRRLVYRKHLGSANIRPTHNYKGYPILGTIFALEAARGDYLLHFDSDMLLHQQEGYRWIDEGIRLMQQHPDLISIRPCAGPPAAEGVLQQNHCGYDPAGFYRFKSFGSRVYLFDRDRFDQLLPLPIIWHPFKTDWLNRLPVRLQTAIHARTGKGKLGSWEKMVTNQLKATGYHRANMASPNAWTLHPVTRSPEFIRALPRIIRQVEVGYFPAEQAGIYDLQLQPWLDALTAETP